MILVIKRLHTKGTSYDHINSDALIRAIKEQHPHIQIKACYADFFTDKEGRQYTFDTSEQHGYCRRSFNKLQNGEIPEIRLIIVEDELQQRHRRALDKLIENPII